MNATGDQATARPNATFSKSIRQRRAPLSELKTLATRVGSAYEMAMRPADTDFPVPSVIHWRVDHYSAVVRKRAPPTSLPRSGPRRPALVSAALLNDEASGYVLALLCGPQSGVAPRPSPEAAGVGATGAPGAADDNDPVIASRWRAPPAPGWRVYALLSMPASLRVTDQPLTYAPAIGPRATSA